MASEKLTDLSAIPTLSAADSFYVVDASDTTDDAAGSSKEITAAALGARYLIEEITLASAGEFDFGSIPAGFNRVWIRGLIRGDVTADLENIFIFLNEDTTATNYHQSGQESADGTAAGEENLEPRIARAPAASSPSGAYSDINILIEDYAGSALKVALCTYTGYRSSNNLRVGNMSVVWKPSTAAITRIRIRTDNHPTDQLVGTLRLYGEF